MKTRMPYVFLVVSIASFLISGCDQLLEVLQKTSEDRDWNLEGNTNITSYPNTQKLQGYTLVREGNSPEVDEAEWQLKNTDKEGDVEIESQSKLRFYIPLEGLANGTYTLKVDIYYTTGEEDHLEYNITINISN